MSFGTVTWVRFPLTGKRTAIIMWVWYLNIAQAYITSHSRGDFDSRDLLIQICDMMHSYVARWFIHICDMTHSCAMWLIHMCNMTPLYLFDITHSYVHVTHVWTSHVAHVNESRHTLMNKSSAHMYACCRTLTDSDTPCRTYEWVVSHIRGIMLHMINWVKGGKDS